MTEKDVEIIIQRAREKYPGVGPRIISDNGPQFIAKEFKAFVTLCGMTHIITSPYYPQSNGKVGSSFGQHFINTTHWPVGDFSIISLGRGDQKLSQEAQNEVGIIIKILEKYDQTGILILPVGGDCRGDDQ